MPLQPPSKEFVAEDAFPGVTFERPVAIITAPGDTNRLFIVERPGRVYVITNLSQPEPKLFLDITHRVDSNYQDHGSEGLTSIAFHPDYRTNGQIFVTYSGLNQLEGVIERFNRLSRFQISTNNPDAVDTDSEAILFTQIDEGYGHNVNEAVFGPDGYLYVSVGDEGDGRGKGDEFNNSQRIDKDFFSGILRLDVDQRVDNLQPNPHAGNPQHYRVPRDNPWVGVTEFQGKAIEPNTLRDEFYAIGLRNPWKMAFDSATGNLFLGDVGLHGREEVNLVVKGGNYGWAYREGTAPGRLGSPPIGTTLIAPLHEYPYDWVNGQCVIGGVVYRGTRMPELHGAYIFADYVLGNIWGLWMDGQQLARVSKINSIPYPGLSAFGIDPRNGDILIADHAKGKILRIEPGQQQGEPLPQFLSDTGIFSDLATLEPHPGILFYDVNTPLWSDNAIKKRWFSLPPVDAKFTFNVTENWGFPAGSVWIKHFELELTKGDPTTKKRLETRVLVKGPGSVYGVTYRWNGDNAELVSGDGEEEVLTIRDGGTNRTQIWRYPSHSECLGCHTTVSGGAIGFNTAQLNRSISESGETVNQLAKLNAMGYFHRDISDSVHVMPKLAPLSDTTQSREYRARSYIAANCANCHQPGAPAHAQWDARASTPLSLSQIINGPLLDRGDSATNRVVVPGDAEHSMMLKRMSKLGPGRMPPLGSNVIDEEAVALIRSWITDDLADHQTYPQWQQAHFGSTTNEVARAESDPDADGADNRLEHIIGSDPHASGDAWRVVLDREAGVLRVHQPANRAIEAQSASRLGANADWSAINTPLNAPSFPATSRELVIPISQDSAARYYRVRVHQP